MGSAAARDDSALATLSLVARDTIEEKILQLQEHKRGLADAIIGEENSILRQLTPEGLDLLLS